MQKKKIKILIIDDEKDICLFEKSYLEKHDFQVTVAQTGLSGITLAKKTKPDIALIDVHLSGKIDGLEVFQKLQKILPQCKCVMATWDTQRALEAKKLGAVDILIKPTQVEELGEIVNRVARTITKRQV